MNKLKKIVITYGTFDLFHIGHLNLLKRAKALGNYLIVAVSTDEFNVLKQKKSFFSYEDRKEIVESCRYVDLVIPESSWDQKESDIRVHHVDTFVMGDDWNGKFDNLKCLCNVEYLERTPGISSSQIRILSSNVFKDSMLKDLRAAFATVSDVLAKFEDLK